METVKEFNDRLKEEHLAYSFSHHKGWKRYTVKAYFDDILTIKSDAYSEEDAIQKAKEDIEARIEELFNKSIFLEVEEVEEI